MKKTITIIALMLLAFIVNAQTTQISTAYCGHTATSTTEFIWADSLGLPSTTTNDRYNFKLVNGATTFTWTTTNEWPILQWYFITGFAYNTTYTASVAWSSDNGATFGAYGTTCTINSPSFPTTSLQTGYCGFTASTYTQVIYAENTVADSVAFKLENVSIGYTQIFIKNNFNFNLAQFTGLTNATTYSVSAKVKYSGTWGPYGNVCSVTTPSAVPTTSLSASNCNSAANSYFQVIFANAVTGATQYEYKLENASLGYAQSYAKPQANFNLSQFTGLSNNTTYSVSVRVNVNNTWGNYGSICTITTPSTNPTTSITSVDCGIIATSYTNQLIHATSVGAATEYTYKLENAALSYSQEYAKPQPNFSLGQFTGLMNNTTYTVSVKVKFMGSYGAYGSNCNITTPATFMRVVNPFYPNPFTEATRLEVITEKTELIYVKVYDKNGKINESKTLTKEQLLNFEIGNTLQTGIYNVVLLQNNEIKTFKIVKQ